VSFDEFMNREISLKILPFKITKEGEDDLELGDDANYDLLLQKAFSEDELQTVQIQKLVNTLRHLSPS